MKTNLLLLTLAILFPINLLGQSDEDLIRHTIHNYFNGTAYNQVGQLEAAFHPEAELYLAGADGGMRKMSAAEYLALYKDAEPGKFMQRYSRILSIEMEGKLAQVKAEILMPKRNWRFIDVFIVRKMSDELWQIVSKAADNTSIK
jgi:hypothetical protein